VLVGNRDWLDEGPPFLRGGGAVTDVSADGVTWAAAPARHEGGTPNLVGAVALAAACEALDELPVGLLQGHERALLRQLDAGLAELPDVRTLRVWPDDDVDRVAVLGFTVTGRDAECVAAWLSAEHGIGVRHGRFCAHRLVSRLVTDDGPTPRQALRVSLGAGSTSADVERFLAAMRELSELGRLPEYVWQDGRWLAAPPGSRRNRMGACGT